MMTSNFIGAIFSEMDSETQAEFFNGLGRLARLKWDGVDLQCFQIMKGLDMDGKSFVRELAKMVGSEEDEQREQAEKRAIIISKAERERDELKDKVLRLEEELARKDEES